MADAAGSSKSGTVSAKGGTPARRTDHLEPAVMQALAQGKTYRVLSAMA